MCATAGDALDLDPSDVLVCSTGVIGQADADGTCRARYPRCIALAMSPAAGGDIARAITTTDTVAKVASATFVAAGVTYTIGGTAKGPGCCTRHGHVARLHHHRCADRCSAAATGARARSPTTPSTASRSTAIRRRTTMCILLANGAARWSADFTGSIERAGRFEDGAAGSVRFARRSSSSPTPRVRRRHFRVAVERGRRHRQARIAARVVAQSPLVKTAIHGGDPNWGRIVAALGRSGATFTLDRCRVAIGGLVVFDRGAPEPVEADRRARRPLATACRHRHRPRRRRRQRSRVGLRPLRGLRAHQRRLHHLTRSNDDRTNHARTDHRRTDPARRGTHRGTAVHQAIRRPHPRGQGRGRGERC